MLQTAGVTLLYILFLVSQYLSWCRKCPSWWKGLLYKKLNNSRVEPELSILFFSSLFSLLPYHIYLLLLWHIQGFRRIHSFSETDSLNICSSEDVSVILFVKSNIGKQPLKLVRQHFPKGHKLNKILNKNNFKVSHSCMRNMSSMLTSHNKKILAENEMQYECNCRNKDGFPLVNKCLTPRVIY